jgi:hypothetical protein
MRKPRRFPFFASSLIVVLGLAVAPAVLAAETPVDATVVKLLSPGKDPKKPLRMTAKVGLRRTMVISMKMGMMENKVPAEKLPEIRMTMDLNVTNVSAAGDIRYEFKIIEFKINTPMTEVDAQVLKAGLALMQSMKFYAIVSNRGFTKEVDLAIPPKLDDVYTRLVKEGRLPYSETNRREFVNQMKPKIKQIKEEIKQEWKQVQMSSPLPEEAVGVGAKWLTTFPVEENGMVLKQSMTSELRSLSGDAAKVSFTIKQGKDVDPKWFTSSGNGEINLDLGRLIPSLAAFHLTASGFKTMGQGYDMAMKFDMTMRMQGK